MDDAQAAVRGGRGPLALPAALAQFLLDWFYPRHCYHCGEPLHETAAHVLCRTCLDEFSAGRITGPVCARCGLPLSGAPAPGTLCLMCRAEERHFDAARAFSVYAGPVASIILAFKFRGDHFLGPRLVRRLLDGGPPPEIGGADVIVPVPLHPRRRRERGYDQALLLARAMVGRLDGKLLTGALVRTRYTSQQALLPVQKRWDNVRGAFAVRKPGRVSGRRVLLVDDVMTTGRTADECAKVLKKAGASHVQVLVLARPAP